MSGTGVEVRELRIESFSTPLTLQESGEGQLAHLAGVSLPALLKDSSLQDNLTFLRFCQENEPLRFERHPRGEVHVMTPAGSRTGRLELYVGRKLDEWADQDGTGTAFGASSGFALPDSSVLAPDASWVALSRWNALTPSQQDEFAPLCPEFVVEVRSPSDRTPAIEAKMRLWMSNGAQLAWLLDPKRKLAVVYRQDREPEFLNQPEFLDGEGPVAGFRLDMKRFWV